MRPRPHGHERADQRNLHLHRAALDKLRHEPTLRQACLALVRRWLADPDQQHARPYLEQWQVMLTEWSPDSLEALVLDDKRGQPLRQCSPLAPTLTPRERWRLLAEINRALATGSGHSRPSQGP